MGLTESPMPMPLYMNILFLVSIGTSQVLCSQARHVEYQPVCFKHQWPSHRLYHELMETFAMLGEEKAWGDRKSFNCRFGFKQFLNSHSAENVSLQIDLKAC